MRVNFFRESAASGSLFLGSDTSAPFNASFAVTDLPKDETVVIKAVAFDSVGRATTITVAGTTAVNVAPVAQAGADRVTQEGQAISFAGSYSDANSTDTHTVHWDFGDGSTAAGSLTPSHVYADDGVYTVTLTVTDNDGAVGSDTLSVTAHNLAPVVDAGPNQNVDEGGAVSFVGSYTDAGSADTHSIQWDFGDGNTASGTLTPSHVYADNGSYTVRLTVRDDDDAVSSDTLVVTVANVAPVVDAGPNRIADEGQTVSFAGAYSDAGVVDTHSIEWDFGDGHTASGTLTPSHVYADNGSYTVRLTVRDDDDAVSSDALIVTVANAAPVVDAGPNQSADEGQAVSFAGFYTDAGIADTHSIQWDFGDSHTASGTLTPSHVYADNGSYTVRLTVRDDDDAVNSDTLVVTVANVAPVVDAGPNQSADEGQAVSFAGFYTDAGIADTHSIEWDFGDGNTASGTLTPSHVYADNGSYTVRLTVRDDDDAVSSDTLVVTVANVAPVVDAGPNRIADEGQTVSFAGAYSDAGIVDTHSIEWDFGDGNTASGTLTPSHVYAENGAYTVRLTIRDDDDASSSDTLVVTVDNVTPTAEILDTGASSRASTGPLKVLWYDDFEESSYAGSIRQYLVSQGHTVTYRNDGYYTGYIDVSAPAYAEYDVVVAEHTCGSYTLTALRSGSEPARDTWRC